VVMRSGPRGRASRASWCHTRGSEIALGLVVCGAAVLALAGCGGGGLGRLPVSKVAARVERIRGLRFHHVPGAQVISLSRLQRLERAHFQRVVAGFSPAQQARVKQISRDAQASAELVALLGLVPPSELTPGSMPSGGPMLEGLYDERSHHVYLVTNELGGNEPHAEVVLAHELDHALDEQHFGPLSLLADPTSGAGDAATALREGTATFVQLQYELRYEHRHGPLSRLIAHPRHFPTPKNALQRLADEQLVFTYEAGARFVYWLYHHGHGWSLVNRAWRHPPSTAAQILHPDLWLTGRAARNPSASLRPYLGASWSEVGAGDIGEEDLAELLGKAGTPEQAAGAATGWAGGHFEVWQNSGGLIGCQLPCRDSAAAVMEVNWLSASQATSFGNQLTRYIQTRLHGHRIGEHAWTLPPIQGGGAGSVAESTSQKTTSLAFAPTTSLAAKIASDTARHNAHS
jgi:hypothetical protein